MLNTTTIYKRAFVLAQPITDPRRLLPLHRITFSREALEHFRNATEPHREPEPEFKLTELDFDIPF